MLVLAGYLPAGHAIDPVEKGLVHHVLVLGVPPDPGSDERAQRNDGPALGPNVIEGKSRKGRPDALPLVVTVDFGVDEDVFSAAKLIDGHGDYPPVLLGHVAMKVWIVPVLDVGLGFGGGVGDLYTSLTPGR